MSDVFQTLDGSEYLQRLKAGLAQIGKSPDNVTIEDLAPADQLHLRGLDAIKDVLASADLSAEAKLVDLGCGLGGPARMLAQTIGCHVTGYDVNAGNIIAGRQITDWVGLADKVVLHEADATAIPAADAHFDVAFSIHVAMFIPHKAAFYREAYRLLKPGGRFIIYDPVRTGYGERHYPLPWANDDASDQSLTQAGLEQHLVAAGFKIDRFISRKADCLNWLEAAGQAAKKRQGPPPLGLHLLNGTPAGNIVKSAYLNLKGDLLDLVEVHATKPA